MKIFTRKKASKKASLSLSMEAIVILILAVTMLGLGLAFVRNMFSNISAKAGNAIDVADLSAKPTENEPVVFSPNLPEVRERSQINVQVGFYNPSINEEWWMMKVVDDNSDGNACSTDENKCYGSIETIYSARPFKLEKDQSIGWNIVFTPTEGTVDGATRAVLLSVQFCAVESQTADSCKENSEIYQKEMFMTVRR
jgi:hypothetical protein